jgi:galactitol-specific phosphotransferase system IIC component
MVMVLYLTSFFGPTVTQTATNIGYELPPEAIGAAQISALSGGNLFAFLAYVAADWAGIVGPVVLLVGAVVLAYFMRNRQYHGPASPEAPRREAPVPTPAPAPAAPAATA